MIDLKSVDIKSVITEALDIEKARKTVVSVHVLLDETASSEFQVFVRSGFSSASPNSRLTIGYYPSQDISVAQGTDLVVIAAGAAQNTGNIASAIRNADIPVLVIAENGTEVKKTAEGAGNPLPSEALISLPFGQPLNEEIKGALADEIGAWIIANNHEKRLAFSLAYPFVRRPLAKDAIQVTAAENAGVGVLVFVPGADMPVMTVNQIKMLLQIAAAYDQPLDKDRIKEIAAVVAGGVVCRGVARKVAGLVPGVGVVVKGAMGYAGTLAIGRAALTYFEEGGSIAGLAGVVSQTASALNTASMKIRNHRAYQVASDAAAPVARKAASAAVGVLGNVAQSAARGTMDHYEIFTHLRKSK
jgi:uncharacterized protein (DUF697 family)